MTNPLGEDFAIGKIVIVKEQFAKRQRSTTILGRAFVVDVSERSTGAFKAVAGTYLYGFWLGDLNRAETRIDSSYISIRETKQFYNKQLPQIMQQLTVEFYTYLQSVLTNWTIEDDNGEQTKFLGRMRSSTPLINAFKTTLVKAEVPEESKIVS